MRQAKSRKEPDMPDRLVYSTDGNTCPVCGQPYKHCRCDQSPSPTTKKSDGTVRIMRDRKHRGGKTVTVITGVSAGNQALEALAQQLKKLCRSRGTLTDGLIQIQPQHCDNAQTT